VDMGMMILDEDDAVLEFGSVSFSSPLSPFRRVCIPLEIEEYKLNKTLVDAIPSPAVALDKTACTPPAPSSFAFCSASSRIFVAMTKDSELEEDASVSS